MIKLSVNSKGHVACKITAPASPSSASPREASQLHGTSGDKALAGTGGFARKPAVHAKCSIPAASSSNSTNTLEYQANVDTLYGTHHVPSQHPSRLVVPDNASALATLKAASSGSFASPFGDRQHQMCLADSMDGDARLHGDIGETNAACTGTERVTSNEVIITPRRKPPPLPSPAMQPLTSTLVTTGSCPLPDNKNTDAVSGRAVLKCSTTRRRTRASASSIPDRNLFRKGVVVEVQPEAQQQIHAWNPTNQANETRLPCKPPCSQTSPALLVSAASSRSASNSNANAKKSQTSWFASVLNIFEAKPTKNIKDGVKTATSTSTVGGKPNNKVMSLSALQHPTGRPSSDTISTVPDVTANCIQMSDSDDDVDDDDDVDTFLDLGDVQYVRMMSNRHSLSGRPAGDVLLDRQRRRSSYHSGLSSSMRSIVSVVEDVEAFYCFPTEVRI